MIIIKKDKNANNCVYTVNKEKLFIGRALKEGGPMSTLVRKDLVLSVRAGVVHQPPLSWMKHPLKAGFLSFHFFPSLS